MRDVLRINAGIYFWQLLQLFAYYYLLVLLMLFGFILQLAGRAYRPVIIIIINFRLHRYSASGLRIVTIPPLINGFVIFDSQLLIVHWRQPHYIGHLALRHTHKVNNIIYY